MLVHKYIIIRHTTHIIFMIFYTIDTGIGAYALSVNVKAVV